MVTVVLLCGRVNVGSPPSPPPSSSDVRVLVSLLVRYRKLELKVQGGSSSKYLTRPATFKKLDLVVVSASEWFAVCLHSTYVQQQHYSTFGPEWKQNTVVVV